MKKYVVMTMLAVAVVLAACAPSTTPASPETPTNASTSSTVAITATEAVEDIGSQADPAAAMTGERSEPAVPVLTPDQVGVVRPQDHFLGASEPLVTIIEYGDFQ